MVSNASQISLWIPTPRLPQKRGNPPPKMRGKNFFNLTPYSRIHRSNFPNPIPYPAQSSFTTHTREGRAIYSSSKREWEERVKNLAHELTFEEDLLIALRVPISTRRFRPSRLFGGWRVYSYYSRRVAVHRVQFRRLRRPKKIAWETKLN